MICFHSHPSKLDVLLQDSEHGACNYYIFVDPYSTVRARSYNYPALSTDLTLGLILHLFDIRWSRPRFYFLTDTADSLYPVPAPVRLLSRNRNSSSLHIGKYVLEVLELLHKKRPISRQPFHLVFSITALWAFHSDIADEYICK